MVREVGAVSIRLLPFNILRHIRKYIFRGKPEQWWRLPTVSLFIITIQMIRSVLVEQENGQRFCKQLFIITSKNNSQTYYT